MFKANLAKTLVEAFATEQGVYQRNRQLSIAQQEANTNSKNADTNRMNARTNAAVGVAQIRSLIAGAIKTAEETSGIRIDNSNKQKIISLTIEGLGLANDEKANKTYIGSDVRNVMDSGGLEGAGYRIAGRLGWILQNVNPFGGLFKK